MTRLAPSLIPSLDRKAPLDSENDFAGKLPGQRLQERFLVRAGDRLPEYDARHGSQKSLNALRGRRIDGATRSGVP